MMSCFTKSRSLPIMLHRIWAKPGGIQHQSPGLRGTSYPGSIVVGRTNPGGVASVFGERGRNPVGVETRFAQFPRVARRLATLGWRTQSLWDCPLALLCLLWTLPLLAANQTSVPRTGLSNMPLYFEATPSQPGNPTQ